MTADEMKAARLDMRYGLRDLSAVLKIPYRTLQDYEYGKRGIPQYVAEAIRARQIWEREAWEDLCRRIDARIAAEFPNGIRSEVVDE